MVRHIVMWNFKEGQSEEQKRHYAAQLKSKAEALKGVIPGLVEITFNTEPLSSSGRSVILNSLLESEAALDGYQIHPEHRKLGEIIGQVLCDRVAYDYHE